MTASHGRRAALAAGMAVALVVAIAAAVLIGTSGTSSGPPAPSAPGPSPSGTLNPALAPTPPAHGVYFGARVKPVVATQSGDIAAVDAFQRQIGRRLDIVHIFVKWHDPFPTPSDLAFLRQGSMLQLSWAGTDTSAIASGVYDGWIRQRALAIKAIGRRIFLEWRWEMDRPNLASEIHSPAGYIAAWDHIRSIFAQEHVTNVAWVWCPRARGFAGGNAAAYYPGDNEVDWVCADAYPGPGPYRSFASIVQPFLSRASRHPKPIMIGEYGVPQTYLPRQRAQWLRDAAATVRSHRQIKALVYFDADAQHAYSLAPGSPALQAFRSMASEPYFNPLNLPVQGG
jgi:hypothetical protein